MMATAPGAATLDALTLSQAALIFACGWILGRLVAGALGRTLSAALSARPAGQGVAWVSR